MLNPIWTSIQNALDELGASSRIAQHQIQACWPELVGPVLSRHTQPQRVQGRTLWITTAGPAWSQELRMRQEIILDALSQRFPRLRIDSLRCRVGILRSPFQLPAPTQEVDLEAITLPASSEARLQTIASEVHDPTLQASLLRAMRQQEKRKVWLRSQGAIPCQTCGHLQNLRTCLGCQQERQRQQRQQLFQLLGREPWITAQEAQHRLPHLSQSAFHNARKQLLSILKLNFYQQREPLKEGQPLPPGLRQLLIEICMLSTATPWDQLQERHIRFSLGRTWARAYLEDKAPAPYQKRTSNATADQARLD